MNQHIYLDQVKLRISCEVLSKFKLSEIRNHSLSNLKRWESQGSWGKAYEEWREILENEDDSILISKMVGLDDEANRLRQSMPYVGMIDRSSPGEKIKTLMDREDWKDLTKAMKIIAEKFKIGVYCSQKYSYLNVEFKTNGMPSQEEAWALEQLEVMVMTASDRGS